MTCVASSIELELEATKTPEIKPFNIINDEQQKEKHAANQFFSSLLERRGISQLAWLPSTTREYSQRG
jgi:hypothetical protein